MKITSFQPFIATKDPEGTIALFEALGFKRKHTKDEIENREDLIEVTMEDANGFRVDIAQSALLKSDKPDMMTIRMNVDSLDEAREMLESRGFKAPAEMVRDASSRAIAMFSPSGFSITLMEHIKKD
ncbi:MAG: hypothetical protein IJT77_06545 [Clostridia bacterium]|nr:hypothetical protein [Clostridia bacterium]